MTSLLEPTTADPGQHVVQFYESDADLISGAGDYLSDGAHAGAVGIVIASAAHREAFEAHLREAGVDVDGARADGTLVLLDAGETLVRFMRDDRVDRDAFFDVVGGVVHAAAATGRPVRAFGEMVALLWEAGDVIGAIDLETFWNELATEVGFSLYCAYHGRSVAGHEHADALEHVCQLHSAVVSAPPVETTWQFAADDSEPRRARALVTESLRQTGHDGDLVDDAQIVITELASNAVRHARSPFSVSLRSGPAGVRIRVRDGSRAIPFVRDDPVTTPSGRGVRLVATLASRWGVDRTADGKVVWAELSA